MYFRWGIKESQHLAGAAPQHVGQHIFSAITGRDARPAIGAWVFIALLASALSGCALSSAIEKCGFRGCTGDAAITAEIVMQFSRCSFLEPNKITVQTLDHVVYLNGAVVSGLEISTAESIALQVPGVRRVMNSVVVLGFR